jgi:hypothetical protein
VYLAFHLILADLVDNLVGICPELALRYSGLQRHIRCCPASRFKLQPEIVDRQVVLHLALAGKEYPLDFLTVNYPVFGES